MATISNDEMLLLTAQMSEHTKAVHDHHVGQIKLGLILTSKPLYVETLNLFVPIYAFLEEALERQQHHKQLGQLYPLLPKLARAPGFRNDIDFFRENCTLTTCPEVDDYVAYLKQVETDNPVALVAWYYHMYMAIFAGGFIIKKSVQTAMKLSSEEEGVQAFTFQGDPKMVRNQLKDIVNGMNLTDEQKQVVLEEGPKVFLRNDALMESLQSSVAFQQAQADCCRYIVKVTVGVMVVIAAIGISLFQSKTKLQV